MHLANGDIPIDRSRLPDDPSAVDVTVRKMVEMAKGPYGARSAKIRALAINLVNAARVPDKDYYGMIVAIHNWVRDTIRYMKDPVGQETLSYPEETAFNSLAGDCDDKTILEMALLGSIGIRSYPVVIGLVQPGLYSHVYLHAMVPTSKSTSHGGEVIPLDPIMRDWPVGKEAPASKVKAKKLYSDLSGLPMLNGYADGPDYLDTQNLASVVPTLRGRHTDSAGGPPVNTKQVVMRGETTDDMFGPGASLPAQKNPLKVIKPAGRQALFARGPMTSLSAHNDTSYLSAAPVRPMRVGAKILSVQSVASDVPSKTAGAPTIGELQGLADYLGALERQPIGVLKAAAVKHYLGRRAGRARHRHMALKRAVALNGLGGAGVPAGAVILAQKTDELAQALARKADLIAERGGAAVNGLLGFLADADAQYGMTDTVMAQPAKPGEDWFDDVARKVATVEAMVRDPEIRRAVHPMPVRTVSRPRFGGMLSGDLDVRDHNGNQLAGFFSSVSKTVKKVASHSIAKKVTDKVVDAHKKVGSTVLNTNKKALRTVGAPGISKGGSTSKQVAAKPGQKYLDANGQQITKAQYDAQMALLKAPTTAYAKKKNGKTSYYLPNGTKITKDQYLAWWRNATGTAAPNNSLPTNAPIIPIMPSAPSDAGSTGTAMTSAGTTSMPLPSSTTPVDTYGPEDVLSTEDEGSGGTATDPAPAQDESAAPAEDSGEDQGPMTDENGYLVDASGTQILDANGNPILADQATNDQLNAAAAAPAASGGGKTLGILGLLGGAWYLLAHK